MSLRKNTYQQITEFNQKTFQEKAKRRKQQAKLPFEAKLEIVEELNALIRDFAERRANKNMQKP
jgi:hypothetical protein